MSDSIVDLDALVPTDKKVLLGGRQYVVPGDIPMEVFVKVNKAGMLEDADESAAIEVMVDALTDLFTVKSEGLPNYEVLRDEVFGILRQRGVRTISRMLQCRSTTSLRRLRPRVMQAPRP
jgi:hypothetical protein